MAGSLFSSILNTLNSSNLGELASRVGEPEQAVSRGIGPVAASFIAGLASKAGNSNWMGQLFSLVSTAPSNVNLSSLAVGASAGVAAAAGTSGGVSSILDSGKKFLSLAFGGNESAVADALGKSTGMRASSVSTLMTISAPVVLAALGRHMRDSGVSQTGLSNLLVSEGAGIRNLLPEGVTGLFGGSVTSAPASVPPVAIGEIREEKKRVSPLWWVIPALLLAGILLWAFGRNRVGVAAPTQTVAGLGDFISQKLPDNVDLRFPRNGVEGRLLAFIQDPTKPVDPNVWFDFDRLLFDTGSATLQPESQDQLANIAAIMKAYPNVHLKIGGYTDNTGDPQQNLKLSQDRANGVVQQLVALGVAPDRLEAQGYGQDHPVADNSTEQGRAQNRRISMSVRQK